MVLGQDRRWWASDEPDERERQSGVQIGEPAGDA